MVHRNPLSQAWLVSGIFTVAALLCSLSLTGCFPWEREGARAVAELQRKGVFEGKLALDKALDADVVCLVPEGVSPNAVLEVDFKKRAPNILYDSENFWFVVAINDDTPEGRIIAVKMTTISMDPKVIVSDRPQTGQIVGSCICGFDMYLTTKKVDGRETLFLRSISQEQP